MNVLPMARPVPPGAGNFRLPSTSQPFVCGTVPTPVGEVPRVDSELRWRDRRGHYLVRWNIGRDSFMVEPGLYALGAPDGESPVIVTANYKLTFDLLRQTLAGRNLWNLVLDTKGINVWCAAGKGTFGTEELLDRIQASRLDEVVRTRTLIVPQLGAPGLAAYEIKKYAGFRVRYGPVMMRDLSAYLDNDYQLSPEMRRKRFPLRERVVLIPVELMQGLRQGIPLLLFFALFGGFFGPGPFGEAFRVVALWPVIAVLSGILAGNVLVPLLLPWIPGRAFSAKGALAGLLLFALLSPFAGSVGGWPGPWFIVASLLVSLAVSSWLGMAFTGASTFTSLHGVRKEMLRAMPLQFAALVVGLILWSVLVCLL